MNKYSEVFNYIEEVIPSWPNTINFLYEEMKHSFDKENKPPFTETGLKILQYLQEQEEGRSFKAKDIAEGLGMSSRTISGGIRKLVTDNYVSKAGQNPVIYTLTEQGRNINIKGE